MMHFSKTSNINIKGQYPLDFNDYIKLLKKDYDTTKVRENFYRVQDKLGEHNPNEKLVAITLRLQGKADWRTANEASFGLEFKVSRKFWGRKSKYQKLPMVWAIESNKEWTKDHLHGLIRIQEPKREHTDDEIREIIKEISYSLDEVNEDDPNAVITRIFPFCEDKSKQLGNSIEYVCKTSSKDYDPLDRKLYPRKTNELQSTKTPTKNHYFI
jgi:hypothetical protein